MRGVDFMLLILDVPFSLCKPSSLKINAVCVSTVSDLDMLVEHTRYFVLLSQVYHKQDRLEDSMLHLTKACDIQSRVLKRAQVDQPDALPTQKVRAARYITYCRKLPSLLGYML